MHALEPPPPHQTRPVCMCFSNMFSDLKPARGRGKKNTTARHTSPVVNCLILLCSLMMRRKQNT